MTMSMEHGSDDSTPVLHSSETDLEKSPKQSDRLATTMQLIRKREDAKRFAEMNAVSAQHDQLSMLLDDLQGVIYDIGDDGRYFDFHLAEGELPQLWIDASTFVVMAKGGEGFRLLKETRAGRVLLRESRGREAMGEAVVHYIVERLSQIENNKMQSQHSASHHENRQGSSQNKTPDNQMMEPEPQVIVRNNPWRSFFWFLTGLLLGVLSLFTYAWFRNDISAYLATL